MNSGSPAQRTNLIAASIALAIVTLAVTIGLLYCERLEHRYIHALAPEFNTPKLQGVALQKLAFEQPDLLVLYGSSELVKPIPNNANNFFRDYPTGFRVFPVGKPGTTALAVLQKVAAIGDGIRGRKVAYSISPGNYFYEVFDSVTGKPLVIKKYYEGNFSELQACELAFNSRLSRELKRDIAQRMLEYPKTIEDNWVLEYALTRLAGDTAMDRVLYRASMPLGWLCCAVGRGQDHLEAAMHILEEDERLADVPKRANRPLNWRSILKSTARFVDARVVPVKRKQADKLRPKASDDQNFLKTVARTKEWTDAELLMRTFKELGAEPLLLSMPIEDIRLEAGGWSPASRDVVVNRLKGIASRYQFPLIDFREHEKDPGFMIDFFDHLSSKGWLYYNQALDDFYHGRISKL